MWEFWGLFNKEFIEEDVKDLHYLEGWPKLTSCPGCEQIIEKSSLSSHLLEEWENKTDFEQWERWNDVIKKDEVKGHVSNWSNDNS